MAPFFPSWYINSINGAFFSVVAMGCFKSISFNLNNHLYLRIHPLNILHELNLYENKHEFCRNIVIFHYFYVYIIMGKLTERWGRKAIGASVLGPASQLPSNEKGEFLMSKSLWITPEEAMRKKKIKKILMYIAIMIGTIVLSTVVTLLANSI